MDENALPPYSVVRVKRIETWEKTQGRRVIFVYDMEVLKKGGDSVVGNPVRIPHAAAQFESDGKVLSFLICPIQDFKLLLYPHMSIRFCYKETRMKSLMPCWRPSRLVNCEHDLAVFITHLKCGVVTFPHRNKLLETETRYLSPVLIFWEI